MVASINPMPAARSPLSRESPLRETMKVIPRIASIKSSGDAKKRTNGRMMGMEIAKIIAPSSPATRELIKPAPRALPASPFLVMG